MRKIFSGIVLFAFYIFFGLAIAEIGVRVADAAPPAQAPGWFWKVPDSTTGWALIPNTSGRYYDPLHEYDIHISVNSRGLRAPEEIGYEKPEGVYRVLVLGDSFIEAAQVELAESFPQRLGALMQAQTGQPVQVLNAGVGGWGNDQQLLWLKEEGYKYQPDLIVLAVYPRNDFMNNYEPLEAANQGQIIKPFFAWDDGQLVRKYWPFDPANVPAVESQEAVVLPDAPEPGPLTGLGQWLHERSALYRYADPRLRIAAPRFAAWLASTGFIQPGQETKLVAQGEDYLPLAYHVYQQEWGDEWVAAYEMTAAIYEEFQRTAVGMGAATAAVLITAPEQVYPEDWETIQAKYQALQTMPVDLSIPHSRAAVALSQAGVPVLDLLAVMPGQAERGERLHFRVDGHYTPAGHELAARSLYNFLAETGTVPALVGTSVPETVPRAGRSPWEWLVLIVAVALGGSLLWDFVKTGPVDWLRKVGAGLSTTGELLGYMARRRQYALLPLVVVLLMFAGLLILAQASVVGPFIYTLI